MEVLLALSIFSVALIGIIEGVAIQVRAEKLAEDTTRATILAQNVLEEIRYMEEYGEESQNGAFDSPNAGFDWEYAMAETEIDGLYTVTVTVWWSDGIKKRSHTIETYLTER